MIDRMATDELEELNHVRITNNNNNNNNCYSIIICVRYCLL